MDFGEEFDCAPGSIQPVVWMNEERERTLGLMRRGFKLPKRLLFNVRSEGVAKANFWKDKFATNRCIVPASSFFEWKDSKKNPKPKYEITVRAFMKSRLPEPSHTTFELRNIPVENLVWLD